MSDIAFRITYAGAEPDPSSRDGGMNFIVDRMGCRADGTVAASHHQLNFETLTWLNLNGFWLLSEASIPWVAA